MGKSLQFMTYNVFLGGGFKYFLFSPLFGEDEPIWTSIFFRWVEKNHQPVLIFRYISNCCYYMTIDEILAQLHKGVSRLTAEKGEHEPHGVDLRRSVAWMKKKVCRNHANFIWVLPKNRGGYPSNHPF